MPPVGFEPTIAAGERPQINALELAATGIDDLNSVYTKCKHNKSKQILL